MAYHRFKLGQAVVACAAGIRPGPYIIIRLLPQIGEEPHYRGQGENGVVRTLLESQIRQARDGKPRNAAWRLSEWRRAAIIVDDMVRAADESSGERG